MKNAVIYARYSSYNQTEMSIEGQVAECRSYAEKNGLYIVHEYIDRAQSATSDRRPEFLHMVADSEWGNFEVILVYQLDRFARNMTDAGYYKKILAQNGVRVVSAKENIASDSSGVIQEGMLFTMGQWYSAQLSEKVTRGMRQRAAQFKYNGGNLTYGFAVDKDGHYILDKKTAPIVREIFERTAAGEVGTEIMKDLNKRGIRTVRGNSFGKNSFQSILRNERYKGTYIYGDMKFPNAIPRIVSDELFDKVQEILGEKKIRGHRPATEDYLLTGKLYCGHCKDQMNGTSGRSHIGRVYRYYTCPNAPKKCDKRNVKKEFIESLVLDACREMLTDEAIDTIIQGIEEQNRLDMESPLIVSLEADIRETEKKINRLIDQIEDGTASAMVNERLQQRENELDDLKKQLHAERTKQEPVDPFAARLFLTGIREASILDETFNKLLVNSLIDRIYLYDDHFRLLLKNSNKKGTTKREAAEIERYFDNKGSTTALGAPPKTPKIRSFSFLKTLEFQHFYSMAFTALG